MTYNAAFEFFVVHNSQLHHTFWSYIINNHMWKKQDKKQDKHLALRDLSLIMR